MEYLSIGETRQKGLIKDEYTGRNGSDEGNHK